MSAFRIFLSIFAAIALFLYGWGHSTKKFSALAARTGSRPKLTAATGISMVSWGAYLVSAAVWLWYGLQKRDKNIYLPCIGWMMLDSAVIVGALVYG